MQQKAFEVLKQFENKGYSAYIVGGYVRDYLLNRKTNDIDICTNATPKEIIDLFDIVTLSDMQYGAVNIVYKGQKFDVTTFRKEIKYEDNRKPIKIKYINDIKKDLLRRDFTINTLCMNSKGEVIDFLSVKSDLDKKIVKTVGNPRYKIKEDSLRILRAIRFATTLDFDIDKVTKHYLTKYGKLLTNLSTSRKKEELNKIFLSKNKEMGRKLLIDLKLVKYLKLDNLDKIILCDDLIGIWCQLNVDDIYPFTKLEKEAMFRLRELLKYDNLDNYTIYKYGLYLCTVYAEIKGIDKKEINERYTKLPIYTKHDIVIKEIDIANFLNRKPGSYIKQIIIDLEKNIVEDKLSNDVDSIKEYICSTYN